MTRPIKKKDRWNLIPAELILLNTKYCLSISPNGKNMHEQYVQCMRFLKSISPYSNIDMYFELSTIARRCHYHGTVEFNTYPNIVKFYNTIANQREQYTYEIDTIDDISKWKKYCKKGMHLYEQFAHTTDRIYNITNESIKKYKTLKEQFNPLDCF